MKLKIYAWLPALSGCLLVLLSINTLYSATITPLDTEQWPGGWTVAANGDTAVSVIERGEKDYLQIRRSGTGIGAVAFWNGNDEFTNGWMESNFSGSVVVRFSQDLTSNNTFGVVVGAQGKTYTGNIATNFRGYYIGIVPRNNSESNRMLGIWQNPTTANFSLASNAVASSTFSPSNNLSADQTYLLEFDVTGPLIKAALWHLDALDQKEYLYAEVEWEASSGINGYFGLMGGYLSSSGFGAQFRDAEIQTVPEPSALLLLVAGGGLLSLRRRRGPSAQ